MVRAGTVDEEEREDGEEADCGGAVECCKCTGTVNFGVNRTLVGVDVGECVGAVEAHPLMCEVIGSLWLKI